MANVSLYYEKSTHKVMLNFTHLGTHARKALPISLQENQWVQKTGEVVNNPQKKTLNIYLQSVLSKCQAELLLLGEQCRLKDLSAQQIRDKICEIVLNDSRAKQAKRDVPTLVEQFKMYTAKTTLKKNSKANYKVMLNWIYKYKGKDAENLYCEDITVTWLNGIMEYMRNNGVSKNSAIDYVVSLKSIFNTAIDEGWTTNYPFRKVDMKKTPPRKRNLTKPELKKLFDYKGTEWENTCIDYFKLTFLLIGINAIDLSQLTNKSLRAGRINYIRSKTSKEYDIKVEKEAMDIIKRHKGKEHLVDFFEYSRSYQAAMIDINKTLGEIAKPLELPAITAYWARHSWASIAFNDCDISIEDISMSLGHSYGADVTNGYVNKYVKKVDAANRKVIDYIFDITNKNNTQS